MKKRLFSLILVCAILVAAFPVPRVLALERPAEQIVEAALEILYYHEGSYGAINPNDNGALSIGKLQWHANRALELLKTILPMNSSRALSILGSSLYNEILTATNWNARTLSSSEKTAVSNLLTTAEGIAAQDALATKDLLSYVNHGIAYGITADDAMVYYCDLENQYGQGGAASLVSKVKARTGKSTIDSLSELHNGILQATSAYRERRIYTYEYCKSLDWSVVIFAPVPVGTYALKNALTGTYLSVSGADANRTNIDLEPRSCTNQPLEIISVGNNACKLHPLCTASRMVNAQGATPGSGSNVDLYQDVSDPTQWWKFQAVSGGYVIRLAYNTDLALTASGSNVIISTYTGASSQVWTLESGEHEEMILPAVQPTATEPGLTEGVICSICGKILVPQEVIPIPEPEHLEIIAQPENFVGSIGSTAMFRVEARGQGLTYQWYYSRNGIDWFASGAAGATTDTLKIPFTAARVGQLYRCEIRSLLEEAATTDAVMMCEALPTITISAQPESFAGQVGETALFRVSASGRNLTYQWYYSKDNGANWSKSSQPGSNSDTMAIPVTAARAGQCYRCEISDDAGHVVYSDQAAIKLVTAQIRILSQPVSCTASLGETASFRVEATGTGLTYQWYYSKDDGRNWSVSGMTGSRTNTLKVQLTAARVGQVYRCAVTDIEGTTLYTDAVTMNLEDSPAEVFGIRKQPQDFVGAVGETAVLYVDAIGSNLTFQWEYSKDGKSWSPSGLPGYASNTLRVSVTAARIGQLYRCVITDPTGAQLISRVVTLKQA